jgi:homeobox protein cut-like
MHEKEKSSLCGNTSALPQVKNLQLELAAKEQENSQLITDIHQLQTSMNKMRDSELAKVTMLEEQLSVKSATITSLEERLEEQHDYEEVKRELNVLKAMEFSSNEDAKTSEPKTLEVLLLEKNRSKSCWKTEACII